MLQVTDVEDDTGLIHKDMPLSSVGEDDDISSIG
jgi:hypothetical protein